MSKENMDVGFIVDFLNKGMKPEEIALKINRSVRTVYRIIEKSKFSQMSKEMTGIKKAVSDMSDTSDNYVRHDNNVIFFPIKTVKENLKPTDKINHKDSDKMNSKTNSKDQEKLEINFKIAGLTLSFLAKLFVIAVSVLFIAFSNYKYGKLDQSLNDYPQILLLLSFGILEMALIIISGIEVKDFSKKAIKNILVSGILLFSVFGANRSIATRNEKTKLNKILIQKNIEMTDQSVKEYKIFLSENKNIRSKRWEVLKAQNALKKARRELKQYNNRLLTLGPISANKTNERGLFIFRLLLLLISVYLTQYVRKDFMKIKELGLQRVF